MTLGDLAKKVGQRIEDFKSSYAKQVEQTQAQEVKSYLISTGQEVTPEQAFRLRLRNMIYQDYDELRHEEEDLRKLRERLSSIGDMELLNEWEKEKHEHDNRVEAKIDELIERKRQDHESRKKEALILYDELVTKLHELKQRFSCNGDNAASLQQIQDLVWKLSATDMIHLTFLDREPMVDMYEALLYSLDRLQTHLLADKDSLHSKQFNTDSVQWW